VQKIVNQNELNPNNVEIKILYKSKMVNKKFNMVLEVNNYVLNSLMKKDKINIGWNDALTVVSMDILLLNVQVKKFASLPYLW
jgi:hypothetical protein